ncbi:D(1A) dopamine receptor-like [Clytia hemisphaerica]|uniref:D(1A) dopamine receptor-like n=1 Tax=Clytia hemisphaerica TaxID=252671 RepID=UPI0034D46D70
MMISDNITWNCTSSNHTIRCLLTTPQHPLNTEDTDHQYSIIKFFLIILLMLMTITTNGMIVAAFATSTRLQKKPSNLLITSQAASDLFTSVIFIPVHLVESYHKPLHVEGFLICYMIFLSLFNLCALCMDRYLALFKPFLHHRLTCIRHTVKQLLMVWTLPCLITLLPLFWKHSSSKAVIHQVFVTIIWVLMCLLVIFMTCVYSMVTKKARRLIRDKRMSILRNNKPDKLLDIEASLTRKELRVVHLFGLLLMLFVTTYLPLMYMNFCDAVGQPGWIPLVMEEISFFTLMLGSVINPIISMYLKKDFNNNLRCFVRESLILKFQNFHNSFSASFNRREGVLTDTVETSFITAEPRDSLRSSLNTLSSMR